MRRALFWSGAVLVALIAQQILTQLFGPQANRWIGVAAVVLLVLSAPALLLAARSGKGLTRWRRWREARRRAMTHHRT